MNNRPRVIPKYFQVEQRLRKKVLSLAPGAMLPSEPELAKEYAVSRSTLRAAIDALASDGLVERIQGRGTFVTRHRFEIPIGYQPMHNAEALAEVAQHRLTRFERVPADETQRRLFGLEPRDEVLRVERMTYKDAVPLGCGTLVLPAALSLGLEKRHFEHGRFFYTLVDHGIDIVRYRLVIESSSIPAELARAIGVRPGLPSINLTRTGLAPDGRALAWVEILTRGDIGRYVLEADFNVGVSFSLSLATAP